MGGSSAGSGNGGGGGGSPNQMAKKQAKAKAKKDRIKNAKTKDKFGYDKPKNTFSKVASDGGLIISAIKNNPFAKTTEKINRDFYDTKVKPYKGNTKSTYEDYITSRGKGEVDTMGRTISKKDGENTIKKVTKTAPTVAEVDQATTNTTPTETAETTEKNRLLKVKKRGRSSSIMTGAKGVTKTSSDYSLGTSSLLGRV